MTLPYETASPDELREQIAHRDRKIANLKGECKGLRRAASDTHHKALKDENRRLCKALSYTAFAPEPKTDPVTVAQAALVGADPDQASPLT